MEKIACKMIDHPIATFFVVGTVADGLATIIRAVKTK